MKDYDMNFLYHPGSANVVAYAFSQLSMGNVSYVEDEQRICSWFYILAWLVVSLVGSNKSVVAAYKGLESFFISYLKARKDLYPVSFLKKYWGFLQRVIWCPSISRSVVCSKY